MLLPSIAIYNDIAVHLYNHVVDFLTINSHENKLFYWLEMWCIYQIVKENLLYSRDDALVCMCVCGFFFIDYGGEPTFYLGCCSADPYP